MNTNAETAKLMLQLLIEFEKAIRTGSDEELDALLSERIHGWALTRQLAGVAEIIAKAWLEQRPQSSRAREILVEHLYLAGQPEEAAALEDGGRPEPVDGSSEKMLAWSRANGERSASF